MAEPTIKQIKIGENSHDIDAKYWGGKESSILNDLATNDYVDKKIFYGTWDEYNSAEIGVGTLVIILDENEIGGNPGGDSGGSGSGDMSGTETTAKLGTAVLGKMKLGQN